MTTDIIEHRPVMLSEAVEALAPRDGGLYIDGTFGRGGYSRTILKTAKTHVIGIDRDPSAAKAGDELSREFGSRFKLLCGPFGAMDVLLAGEQIREADGIVFDLGVSSPQFDDPARGFSFQYDGPLDMRMSQSGPTVADLVNDMDETELADVIYTCGEERCSRRVARRIVEARAQQPITRTRQLADLVRSVVPRSADGIDPATRTFQALRIRVNDELGELRRGLAAAEAILKPRGRLAVVSFHSLEDRTVKDFLRFRCAAMGTGAGLSRYLPVANDQTASAPSFRLITRKPQTPTADETRLNPRARSARLRIAERTDAPALRENAS
ncbi:MAG: 16S rRNA (cytosine(1402)-N(4))-methyltransferase RsmH [Bdellovibrionales bacterium]